ncbi:hypothetical protein QFZ30_003098 [Arthrobacter pascens]|nr:hypothetical protein [Arthrobacter pascens]MDQ0679716.1 hypothetical protein [Arthrobacter pascens]
MEPEVRGLRLRTGITVPCLIQGEADAPPVLLPPPADPRTPWDAL